MGQQQRTQSKMIWLKDVSRSRLRSLPWAASVGLELSKDRLTFFNVDQAKLSVIPEAVNTLLFNSATVHCPGTCTDMTRDELSSHPLHLSVTSSILGKYCSRCPVTSYRPLLFCTQSFQSWKEDRMPSDWIVNFPRARSISWLSAWTHNIMMSDSRNNISQFFPYLQASSDKLRDPCPDSPDMY